MGGRGEPEFGEPIKNVTVALGREAQLSCIVDNLGNYKVNCLANYKVNYFANYKVNYRAYDKVNHLTN